ncbi:efflux RND transporter periplasmic adaptor subunit [Aquimarina sp. D1M17]|uniref:efflux RND transporter periplasmic adaptor subunit n=1 Tax=Aquimarina acroporae TaxID=2937283 RepID=UPI0020C0565F|nr:efflux RND transporter periplasmic adaptor subunit [Aquimarina acroporae]MCK8523472.1 efflux RND transporter periplasmic adaptor subunit [Aquimarina acroporae]
MNKKIVIFCAISIGLGLFIGYLIFKSPKETSNHIEAHSDHNEQWTCSMHPQIVRDEPGDCPICGMDLIPVEGGSNGLSQEQFRLTENAIALANIQTTVVGNTQRDGNNGISISGKIAANEKAIAVQASYFDGRIEQLNANYEGQNINKGQLLATIYSPELVATQQELITAASLKESQPRLYEAVRNKLKLWKLSDAQIQSIESSEKVRDKFPVYATVSGTVTEVIAVEGDYVKRGQPIIKVSNLGTVWAEFDVYERQLSQFKKGQNIAITANAYPDQTFKGVVSFIDPVLNTATRTTSIRVVLTNNNALFKPGMFVNGIVETKSDIEHVSKLLVPASSVMWTGKRSLVYVKIKPDEPIFEMKEVVLGVKNGDNVEVLSGLQPGEEIVTNGTFTVDAAAQLQGKKSMMNKKDENNVMDATPKTEMSRAFQKSFLEALSSYFEFKNAFVDSNVEEVSNFGKTLLSNFNDTDITSLSKSEKSYFDNCKKILGEMLKTTNIDTRRKYFVNFNKNMVELAMLIEGTNQAIYVQKCPMADGNKGAIWLSESKEVKNPYYGDLMLNCGEVIETIK